MADDLFTVAEVATIGDGNLSGIEVSSLFDDAPYIAQAPAIVSSYGNTHKYLDYTGQPTVGFRAGNAGRDHDRSEDTVRTMTLTILDASCTVDVAVAEVWPQGPEAFIMREAVRHLRAAFFKWEVQVFNGTTDGDAAGHAGLAEKHGDLSDAYTLSAGGTTALSSVYFLRQSADENCVIVGNQGRITIDETVKQQIAAASDATARLFVYGTNITAWTGFQYGAYATSSVRIANLDAGTNNLDDDTLYLALEQFPAGRQPNLCVMGRRSLAQLRASRTATNSLGTPAKRPTEIEGIPILVTDAIGVAETAVADV
jgi:hypothetical protein